MSLHQELTYRASSIDLSHPTSQKDGGRHSHRLVSHTHSHTSYMTSFMVPLSLICPLSHIHSSLPISSPPTSIPFTWIVSSKRRWLLAALMGRSLYTRHA